MWKIGMFCELKIIIGTSRVFQKFILLEPVLLKIDFSHQLLFLTAVDK